MGINVLFVYPNTFGMNMLPPAIALFSALLKERGHKVEIFDSTYYQTDYGIDSDGTKMDFFEQPAFLWLVISSHGLVSHRWPRPRLLGELQALRRSLMPQSSNASTCGGSQRSQLGRQLGPPGPVAFEHPPVVVQET